jgi:hypothetical protein
MIFIRAFYIVILHSATESSPETLYGVVCYKNVKS